MKVLVISRQQELAATVAEHCVQAGYHPVCMQSITQLLSPEGITDYPIIVIDQCFPEFTTLCESLLNIRVLTPPRVILLVTDHLQEWVQLMLSSGTADMLPLPLPSAELIRLRLKQAERQYHQDERLNTAEAQLADTSRQLVTSREDLQAILNHLRLGTAMTAPDGNITFLSEEAKRMFELDTDSYRGQRWEEVFPFKKSDLLQLQHMLQKPADDRSKIQLHLRTPGGRYYWIDSEVLDDPYHPERKIFFFYDMSEMYGLRRMLDEKAQFHDLVGKSKPMRQVYQNIQEVASVDMTVLVEGETGTGKELVARAIHSTSHRKDKPFIAVNCAGLTDSLLTSQLFGHKRGAFTGAIEDHKGVFEAANGGTLFLDEIGEIPINVQTTLLRVLQEREVTRIGDSSPRKVDVRVITATNRNLMDEVKNGAFRADLLYRIRVARISMPPLRDRREDIPLLVGALITKTRAATGKHVDGVSDSAMRRFLAHPWPGNVRELVNAVEVAVLRCREHTIQEQDLPPEILETETSHVVEHHHPQPKDLLLNALQETHGNRKKAAQLLGMSRATFYRHLTKHGIATE